MFKFRQIVGISKVMFEHNLMFFVDSLFLLMLSGESHASVKKDVHGKGEEMWNVLEIS